MSMTDMSVQSLMNIGICKRNVKRVITYIQLDLGFYGLGVITIFITYIKLSSRYIMKL